MVSEKGLRADPEKVQAVKDYPEPRNLTESRSFIGLVSYYRQFIERFSAIADPITSLTRKDTDFVWGTKQQQAFEELKRRLSSSPIIRHFDPGQPAILQADASAVAWGYIISQVGPDGKEHPIFIESGKFSGHELNYTVGEKEFVAILEAFRRRKHHLLPIHTTVLTDHHNLTYFMRPRQLNPRQARWVTELAPFDFTLQYRPGRQATMPDALSRNHMYHPG